MGKLVIIIIIVIISIDIKMINSGYIKTAEQ